MKWKFKGQLQTDPVSTMGIIYLSAKKYSIHVSSTTHLYFKGHFNNQDVPKKRKRPQNSKKNMAILYQSLLESTNTVLNQAVIWIKQITMSRTQKYLPELIQMPCKHSQNRLWRKKRKKLKEVLGERAKLGLDLPLWPFLHPCLWWTVMKFLLTEGQGCISQNTLRAAE